LLASLIVGILLTLLIALLGGFWLADRAMRPVKTITQAAQNISETDLSLRLHLTQKDELGELADTFDEMLNRLQAAFERQRQFTADASHELRTPLTIVDLETSRALANHRSPQEYERVLRVVQSENQMMIHMVVNLLTLARMDAGQVTLKKEELDLSDVTLEVVERMAPLASRENVRFSVGELPELHVLGDRQYLAQMLTNLVENAIKYTSGEDKHVLVETGSDEAGKDRHAWVRVIDNGPGIPAEHLPHVFDRFYQVDSSRTRKNSEEEAEGEQSYSGTGLGLSIVQWIVQAHEGQIQVRSEVGKGSTFEISIPMLSTEMAFENIE
jgi:signal transduction histidine kinase